jgi:hypothetical protein
MNLNIKISILLTASICFLATVKGQHLSTDVQAIDHWELVNRTATRVLEKSSVRLSQAAGAGMMILKGADMGDGTIELDIKGSHERQQSFVGVAFHIQNPTTFDAVYFRPFNFSSNEALQRGHGVQYISMPNNDWEKLRNEFPGKYEHEIFPAPDPDEWFHVKIVLKGIHVSVYVNNEQQPSLEVDRISRATHGGLGLWVGNNSPGSFAHFNYSPM